MRRWTSYQQETAKAISDLAAQLQEGTFIGLEQQGELPAARVCKGWIYLLQKELQRYTALGLELEKRASKGAAQGASVSAEEDAQQP